ncbi:hypothetical protein [Rufibacter soli]
MAKKLPTLLLACLLFFSCAQVSAQNAPDELEAYVQKLKSSKITGGNETAFMSIGSDFLYAQEYFEAGNYSSAAAGFMAILRRQKDHPFSNYQLAIALLRQNEPEKAKQAQQFLNQAFALTPSLKERYAKDMPQSASTDTTNPPTPTPKDPEQPKKDAPASSNQGLAAYIARIKHSNATRGKETEMFSPGQEAHSGIEYYEAGEFGSAETRFNLSLARDANNPYVNYLAAVSLAAQGKPADRFYQKAIAGDASLQNQYAADVAKATAEWNRKLEAKAPKTSPATKVVHGGPLVFGKYTCHQSIWNGPNTTPAYRFDYKGYFELKKDGTYRWLDDGGTGRYSYNAKTGGITWLSGPMKGQAPISSKYQPSPTVPQVTVQFSENYRWECGCKK